MKKTASKAKKVRTPKKLNYAEFLLKKWGKILGYKVPPVKLVVKDYDKPKIQLASRDEVKKLSAYTDKIVEALGHPEAMVTDESYVSDFLTVNFNHDDRCASIRLRELKRASKRLKIKIEANELIIDVAKRLMKNEQRRK